MTRYSLEEMIEIFTDHDLKYRKQNQEQINRFKKDNPSVELPEWLKEDFSLPRAIRSICEEILKLKAEKIQ